MPIINDLNFVVSSENQLIKVSRAVWHALSRSGSLEQKLEMYKMVKKWDQIIKRFLCLHQDEKLNFVELTQIGPGYRERRVQWGINFDSGFQHFCLKFCSVALVCVLIVNFETFVQAVQ